MSNPGYHVMRWLGEKESSLGEETLNEYNAKEAWEIAVQGAKEALIREGFITRAIPARLDSDRKAKPLTKLVHFPPGGDNAPQWPGMPLHHLELRQEGHAPIKLYEPKKKG